MSPGADENSAEMRVGLDKLRRVAEQSGCVFVVLLHAKKTSGAPDEHDARELFRGSSAIFDAADTAFAVVRVGKKLCVQQTKARHGRAVDSFLASIVDVNGGVAVVAADEHAADEKPVDPFDAKCAEVLAAVRKEPGMSGRFYTGVVGGTSTRVYAAIDRLVAAGEIVNLGESPRTTTYRPSADGS